MYFGNHQPDIQCCDQSLNYESCKKLHLVLGQKVDTENISSGLAGPKEYSGGNKSQDMVLSDHFTQHHPILQWLKKIIIYLHDRATQKE